MAAPQARRELELRLKVVTDATAAKGAMDQLAASAERVEKATSRAQQAVGRIGTPGIGGIPAMTFPDTPAGRAAAARQGASVQRVYEMSEAMRAAGLGGGGSGAAGAAAAAKPSGVAGYGAAIAGRFGLPTGFAGPAAAAAAVYQVARTATAISAANQDELLSDNERGRAVFKSLPFGETGLAYMDVWSGRAAGMRRAAEEGQIAAAVSQARTQFRGQQLALGSGVVQSQAQAAALGAGQAVTLPNIDRSTAAGERQYRLESQLLAVRERSAAADRASQVAKEEATDAEKQANQLAREGEQIDRRRSTLRGQIDQAGNRGTWHWWVTNSSATAREDEARRRWQDEFDRSGAERQGNAQQQVEQLRRMQEARQRQIQAEAEMRRAGADRLRVEADDLDERAGRASSLAQRVATSPRDRISEAIYAAERFNRRGLRALDPSEIALLQEFGADDVRTAAEREGRRDPRYARLARLLPQTYPDGAADPEALRGQARDRRNEAAKQQYEADRLAAELTANVMKNVAGLIEQVLRSAMAQVAANLRNDQQRGRGSS